MSDWMKVWALSANIACVAALATNKPALLGLAGFYALMLLVHAFASRVKP